MNRAALLFPIVLAAFATSASAADVSGTWSASAVVEQNGQIVYTTTPVCTFQQDGNQLTGTCKGPHAAGPANGTVNGSSVSWQWTATNAAGVTGESMWHGTLDPDGVIRGKMSGHGMKAPFTAQRQ